MQPNESDGIDDEVRRRLASDRRALSHDLGAAHVDEGTLAMHATGELPEAQALEVTRHLAVCDDGRCVELLRGNVSGLQAAEEALFGKVEEPGSPEHPRSFQCREALWEAFERMGEELGTTVDSLINEAMREYTLHRSYAPSSPQLEAAARAAADDRGMNALSDAPDRRDTAAPPPELHTPSKPPRTIRGMPPPMLTPAPPPLPPASGRGGPPPLPRATPVPPPLGAAAPAPAPAPFPAPSTERMGGTPPPFGAPPAPPRPAVGPPPGYPEAYGAPQAYGAPAHGPAPPPYGQEGMAPPFGQPPGAAPQAPAGYGSPYGGAPPAYPGQPGPPMPAMQQQPFGAPQQPPYPGAQQQRATLVAWYAGSVQPVDKDRFIIGRGKQSSDLVIKDPNVSRQHAMIEYLNGVYYIVDMGSTNGVEFHGERISRKAIDEGDVYTVCGHEIRFSYRR